MSSIPMREKCLSLVIYAKLPLASPEEPQQDEPVNVTDETGVPEPRRPIRVRRPNSKYTLLIVGQYGILLLDNDEPKNYTEVVRGSKSERWLDAMQSELESMRDNQVCNLVDPPDGVRAVECKWIFKKKLDADGNVHIY
jgi:hypothetical protein